MGCLLQAQSQRAHVKEIQINQVSCASSQWSVMSLSTQEHSGMYFPKASLLQGLTENASTSFI